MVAELGRYVVCLLESSDVPVEARHRPSPTFQHPGGSSSGARLPVICLLLSCQALEAQASPRRNRSSRRLRSSVWDNDPESNNYATHMTDLAWPILQNLGFSGAVGVVCAIALKVLLFKTLLTP